MESCEDWILSLEKHAFNGLNIDIFLRKVLIDKTALFTPLSIEFQTFEIHKDNILNSPYKHKIANLAAFAANYPILNWVKENNLWMDYRVYIFAGFSGNLQCLNWLVSNSGVELRDNIYYAPVLTQNIDMICWLKNKILPSYHILECAANTGNIEFLEWIKINSGCLNLEIGHLFAYDKAIKQKNLDMVKWIFTNYPPEENNLSYVQNHIVSSASVYFAPNILEWAHDNNFKFKIETYEFLAHYADFESFKKYTKDILNPDLQISMLKNASNSGNLEIVKFIINSIELNCFCDLMTEKLKKDIMTNACHSGNFELVKWLQDKNYGEINLKNLMIAAIINQDLDLMNKLYEMECPMDNDFYLITAVKTNNLTILNWLKEKGAIESPYLYKWAESVEVLEWLISNNYPRGEANIVDLIELHDLKMIKLYKENGFPCDNLSCDIATIYSSLDILHYLIENGCPCDKEKCISNSLTHFFQIDISEWFRINFPQL